MDAERSIGYRYMHGNIFGNYVYVGNNNVMSLPQKLNTIYEVEITINSSTEKITVSLNGVEYQTNYNKDNWFGTEYNDYLFTTNRLGGLDSYPAPLRLYYVQFYDDTNTLVRNFIPCINPSGEYGMYDTVTRQFFGNKGSGSFTGVPKGRPLKLNNFAFSKMSGVGGYDISFKDYELLQRPYVTITDSKISVTKESHSFLGFKSNMEIPSFTIKITGIKSDNRSLFYKYTNSSGDVSYVSMVTDGIYIMPKSYSSDVEYCGFSFIYKPDIPYNDVNITIELLPNYPNALVTDGVDDYGFVQNIDYGVKTVFLVNNPLLDTVDKQCVYDQRYSNLPEYNNFIIRYYTEVAFTYANAGVTYINGKINNYLTGENLINTKHIITIVSDSEQITNTPRFFTTVKLGSFIKTAFYSAIGFNRTLTQEEINWVIKHMIDTTDVDMNLIPD